MAISIKLKDSNFKSNWVYEEKMSKVFDPISEISDNTHLDILVWFELPLHKITSRLRLDQRQS